MPICNTAAMNVVIFREISSQVAPDAHAAVILDRAGWHRSQGLVVPGNITLLELPPYSPELNPVERIRRGHAAIGSPIRCLPAWRTSWMPARPPGTGLPPITP